MLDDAATNIGGSWGEIVRKGARHIRDLEDEIEGLEEDAGMVEALREDKDELEQQVRDLEEDLMDVKGQRDELENYLVEIQDDYMERKNEYAILQREFDDFRNTPEGS
jgi:chromosome segregation ATPase